MKKWIKRIVVISAIIISAFVLLIGFNYFSIADRVNPATTVVEFKNSRPIRRLTSVTIQPASLTNYVQALMQRANVHGLAISIVNDNELVYQRYFGQGNKQKNQSFVPGCIWYGASLSKTIFADIVLQLAEENVLHLDTPLYRYLKKPLYTYSTNTIQQFFGANFFNYEDLRGDDRYKKITARMCLAHTTGLPNWRMFEPDQKLRIKFEPGSTYSYSGEGMFLLQFIVEELTGRDFEEIAVDKVFKPRNLERSSFVWQRWYEDHNVIGHSSNGGHLGIPKRNVPNAAGSLSTTLEEYTQYFMTVLEQKESRYQMLIAPQIRIRSKQQFGPNALVETDENDDINLSYGLGYGLYDTPFGKAFFKEGHSEGWQHYVVGFPEKGCGLVLMSNSDNSESIFNELIEYTTGNVDTPWYWEGYIPFNKK
jgi:serine-type D-Ala-D-Ala carboxypeptidase/endopeptidase